MILGLQNYSKKYQNNEQLSRNNFPFVRFVDNMANNQLKKRIFAYINIHLNAIFHQQPTRPYVNRHDIVGVI